ncbi:hypothetical protein [Pseudomonas baetica]|uniref:hypothetical protein n=1 Tax=Pseudomonas baetica TaxID=674054 RepID=UPI001EDCAAD1|nr:hypothetical protein [Pseudomonas baetica]
MPPYNLPVSKTLPRSKRKEYRAAITNELRIDDYHQRISIAPVRDYGASAINNLGYLTIRARAVVSP